MTEADRKWFKETLEQTTLAHPCAQYFKINGEPMSPEEHSEHHAASRRRAKVYKWWHGNVMEGASDALKWSVRIGIGLLVLIFIAGISSVNVRNWIASYTTGPP